LTTRVQRLHSCEQLHISHRVKVANSKRCVGFSGEVEIVGGCQNVTARKMPGVDNHIRKPIAAAIKHNFDNVRGKRTE